MVCFSICSHNFFTWPIWGAYIREVYIFEKQGKADFRNPSVAEELIPTENEFRLTKRLVALIILLVFAIPVTVVPDL